MRRFEYLIPEAMDDATRLCAEGSARGKAGGVDLLDLMKEGIERPAQVVGLHRVLDSSVKRLRDGGTVQVGAGITLAELARELHDTHPALAHAAGDAATPAVREMGTLGGNLVQRPRCWYFRSRHYQCLKKGGDLCWAQEGLHETHALFDNFGCAVVHPSNTAPALVAMNAELHVEGPSGHRTVAIGDFFTPASRDPEEENALADGEIITHVILPKDAAGPRSAHYEVRHKQSSDWPLAIAAVNLNGSTPKLVLGAVASTPVAVPQATAAIQAWLADRTPAKLDAVADQAVVQATPLDGNAWRLPLARTAVKRALLTAAGVPEEQW